MREATDLVFRERAGPGATETTDEDGGQASVEHLEHGLDGRRLDGEFSRQGLEDGLSGHGSDLEVKFATSRADRTSVLAPVRGEGEV